MWRAFTASLVIFQVADFNRYSLGRHFRDESLKIGTWDTLTDTLDAGFVCIYIQKVFKIRFLPSVITRSSCSSLVMPWRKYLNYLNSFPISQN